jgi:hypothetical protein
MYIYIQTADVTNSKCVSDCSKMCCSGSYLILQVFAMTFRLNSLCLGSGRGQMFPTVCE